MGTDYQLFIGGAWTDGAQRERFPTINPYTGEAWASLAQADESDVHSAIAAARHAFETKWKKTPGVERAKLLNRLADLLDADASRMALLESTDNGKVIRETKGQMAFASRNYRFFAGYADKLWGSVIPLDQGDIFDYASREPVGVCVCITAWNSPMTLLSNKLAPALAAGNTVVIKPSEHASATTAEFCKLIEKAGFPPGVVNLVTGDARVGVPLVSAKGIDRVSFTGSPTVGREIAAAAGRNLVPVTLELGGKSPNIIFADADLDKAVVGALAGIFGATGQTCVAGSRLLVQHPVYETVVQRLVARAKTIVMGDPTDPATEMGTAANERQFNKILDCISGAKKDGARLATGGEPAREGKLARGLFIQPTIFADVRNDMYIAQEEVFGPVLSIIPFETDEDAIAISNASRYGLAAGVWTKDISRAMRLASALHVGTVWVNTYRAVAAQAPSGGMKESGFGRERGAQALDEYLAYKNVMIDYSNNVRDPFAIKT